MDIASLLDSLSDEDVRKLKETAAQFFGNKEEEPKRQEPESRPAFPMISTDMLTSVAKFSSMMNQHDPRSDFLMALKPLLSEPRRKKADDAAMLLKFLKIISAMEGER